MILLVTYQFKFGYGSRVPINIKLISVTFEVSHPPIA